jgi:tetratricopeptide (TPR) repeat protein
MRLSLAKILRVALVAALVALASNCKRTGPDTASQDDKAQRQAGQSSSNGVGGVGVAVASPEDAAKLDADIERLEKATERNPGDEDTRDELAKAYVRRGDAERASGQPQEALKDYQRALRLDPDNGEAQKNAADTQEQLGGEQQDENGAPAPAPITPNVADEDDKPAPTPGGKPTPKRQ